MKSFAFVVVDVDAGVPLADRVAYAAAQQRQLREHFASMWDGLGSDATVRAATPDAQPRVGEIVIQLLKNPPADVTGALAFHSTQPDGTPICYVFVGLLASIGEGWTSAASHEVLEVLGDPRLRLCVEMSDGTIWDHEVCDRVENSSYSIDGVLLSDFNSPEAFEPPSSRASVRYDWLGLSSSPNQVLPGGYAQKLDLSKGWTQIQNGELSPYRAEMLRLGLSRGARRGLRLAPRPSWFRRLLSIFRL